MRSNNLIVIDYGMCEWLHVDTFYENRLLLWLFEYFELKIKMFGNTNCNSVHETAD